MTAIDAPDLAFGLPAQDRGLRDRTVKRILENLLALGASQVFTMASSATIALVLPRFLGDVNLGKLSFGAAYIAFFGLLTGLGTATYLTKEVARNSSVTAAYTVNAAVMRLPLSLVAFVSGIVVINLLGYDELTKKTVYLLFIGMTLASISDVLVGSLQGLQTMKPVAVAQVAGKIVNAVSVTALLLTGYGLLEVALATSLSNGVGLVVTIYALVRHADFRISVNLAMWRPLLLGGLPFFVWQVSLLIYGQVDLLMLSALTHDAVVGWYAAAYRIISIPMFIPVIVITVIFPPLSAAAASRDLPSFDSIARRALQAVLLSTVPMAAGLILLSDKLIDLFHYPAAFERSVPLIIILALHLPIVAADMIIGTALNARDRQRQWALIGVAAALLNPALNGFMIPLTHSAYGNGAIGAAGATLATEVFMLIMGLCLLPRDVLGWSSLSIALRCVASALAMAAVVWAVRDLPIVVPVALGALVYSGSCLLLRAVFLSDLRRLWLYMLERQRAQAVSPG